MGTASYVIVDTFKPTISHVLLGGSVNSNNWYKNDVTISFACADAGSVVQSCLTDDATTSFKTLGEGARYLATATAVDWVVNASSDSTYGINTDKTTPACVARDALSGVDRLCSVGGGGRVVG